MTLEQTLISHAYYISAAVILIGLFALLLTRRGLRFVSWVFLVSKQQVAAGEAKLSDFISVTSVSLTIAAAILAYWGIAVQARKTDLEQRSKMYADSIAATRLQIQHVESLHLAPGSEPMRLEYPVDGEETIGSQIDLQWNYSKHSNRTNYIVQVVSLSRHNASETDRSVGCNTSEWTFYATEPTAERSRFIPCSSVAAQLPFASSVRSPPPGEYLWRVAPAKLSEDDDGHEVSSYIAAWSEYQHFYFYPSAIERILDTKHVLVGTAYSANPAFSGIDSSSRHVGHDIDLIRILISGCLNPDFGRRQVNYDRMRCSDLIKAYQDRCAPRDKRVQPDCYKLLRCDPNAAGVLCPEFVTFSSAGEGLEALSQKKLDVFIGGLTKAQSREKLYNLRFSSGYYPFRSKLYAKYSGPDISVTDWLSEKDRLVGVVENSTNKWLATELAAEDIRDHAISVVTFGSIPELEAAFDRGEVDGILLDDVVESSLDGAREVRGIENLDAWGKFKDKLGVKGDESFAIAVVAADNEELDIPCRFRLNWFQQKIRWKALPDESHSIYCPIEQALTENYDSKLRKPLRGNYGIIGSAH